MKRSLFLIILLLVSFSTMCTKNEGWTDLFNGVNLNGWNVLDGKAKFKVENGVIVGVSTLNTPNTFLATKQEFSDFVLECEAKMNDGLNSGIQIRSQSIPEYHNGRVHGYQVELDPSSRAWSGGIYDEARRGWLYNLECNQPAKSAYKHENWNKIRIAAIGRHIRVWFNGVQTADLIDDMTPKGFIAFQVHSIGSNNEMAGKTVRFRNIRIKTANLDRERSPLTKTIPQISYLTNELTDREKKDGWKLLWDGKSTNGWRSAKQDHFPTEGWKIENGILSVLKGSGAEAAFGGDIITIDKFKNFELEVDFKFTESANSGIKYFVDPGLNKGEGSAIGCEYQILDDRNHPDAKNGTDGNRTLASLYDLIPADAKFYAPNESKSKRVNKHNWNRAKIIVRGNHVQHFLNGIKVVDYERRTQMWRALVARSKYVTWPNFGELSEGHILLQDHGDVVYFKNIKIRVLED